MTKEIENRETFSAKEMLDQWNKGYGVFLRKPYASFDVEDHNLKIREYLFGNRNFSSINK